MSTSFRQQMEMTIHSTVAGFNAPLDYDALRATRSDSFIYQFLPLSLASPARNNDEYEAFFKQNLKPLFTHFHLKPKTIMYDVELRKATLHGFVDTTTFLGEQALELVIMFSFDADAKVERMDEFFDSQVYSDFFTKIGEVMTSVQSGEK